MSFRYFVIVAGFLLGVSTTAIGAPYKGPGGPIEAYAHCTWWNDNSGQLAFANLENLAKLHVPVQDLHDLDVHHVTVPHLQSQFAYFEHADDLLIGVIQEGNRRAGKPAYQGISIPAAFAPPAILL